MECSSLSPAPNSSAPVTLMQATPGMMGMPPTFITLRGSEPGQVARLTSSLVAWDVASTRTAPVTSWGTG